MSKIQLKTLQIPSNNLWISLIPYLKAIFEGQTSFDVEKLEKFDVRSILPLRKFGLFPSDQKFVSYLRCKYGDSKA